MFGDSEQLTAILNALPDEDLWAVVRRRVPWANSARVRALSAKGRYSPLSSAEQSELTTLIDEADQRTLLRSCALRLLKQRGHDIDAVVSPGTKVDPDAGEATMEGLPAEWFDRDIASDEPLVTSDADIPLYTPYGDESIAQDLLDALHADEAPAPPHDLER